VNVVCTGYLLLAGRVRHSSEENEIIAVLESVFRHKIDPHAMFSVPAVDSVNVAGGRRRPAALPLTLPLLRRIVSTKLNGFDGVVWTYNMRRMAVLVEQALRFAEPVLLVGETGCVGVSSLVYLLKLLFCSTVVVPVVCMKVCLFCMELCGHVQMWQDNGVSDVC